MTERPRKSIRRVFAPASRRMSALVPTFTMRSPLMATACAIVNRSSTVMIFPLERMMSGVVCWAATSETVVTSAKASHHFIAIPLPPAQIAAAIGQIPEALSRNLEYCIADRGLDRSGAVVTHAEQPVPGLEETDVDLGRVLIDARQLERIEIILNDVPVFDRVRLVHRVVVEPGDLTFELLLHR